LINPVCHATTPAEVELYKVEPYVVCGDVYGAPPHTGRGGWTWYTGSASWLYRTALETLLGFQVRGNQLTLAPCIPAHWPRFEMTYRYRSATYQIKVDNPSHVERGVQSVQLDGKTLEKQVIEVLDDGKQHVVEVTMGGAV
jgi:cellobiose phosphorylase